MKGILLATTIVILNLATAKAGLYPIPLSKDYYNLKIADRVPGALTEARKDIDADDYYFKRKISSSNLFFYASCRQLGIEFNINPFGYNVSPERVAGKFLIDGWKEQLNFLMIRKGDKVILPKGGFEIEEKNDKINYRYNGFSIQYANNEQGLKQHFVLTSKLPGNESVIVQLKIDGTLSASVKDNNLQFEDEAGVSKLSYNNLTIWDANNHPVKATMELTSENIISIIIPDKKAKYPLTIELANEF